MCPAQVNDLVTRAAEVAGRQDPSPELPRDRGLPLAGLQAVCVRGGVLWASPGRAPGCWGNWASPAHDPRPAWRGELVGVGVSEKLGRQVYFLHPPLQGAPSQDPFQWREASSPHTSTCGLEATAGPASGEERQPSPRSGAASPGRPPPAPGPPQVPSPAPAGGLCAGHLPSAEPQPPPMAAGWVSRPTGLSPYGPQQPPQLWLRWRGPSPRLAPPGCCTSVPELRLGPLSPPSPRSPWTSCTPQSPERCAKATPTLPHQVL